MDRVWNIRALDFEFVSDFEFRASDLFKSLVAAVIALGQASYSSGCQSCVVILLVACRVPARILLLAAAG
jgi:hypothetical protein